MISLSNEPTTAMMYIRNLLENQTLTLMDDCTDTNIHFMYRGIEVTTDLRTHYDVFGDPDDPSYVGTDGMLRQIIIHLDLTPYLEENLDYDDLAEDDDEDSNDPFSYDNKVKNHFPGMFVDDGTLRNYAKAGAKIAMLNDILDADDGFLFSFVHKNAVVIGTRATTFLAPERSMDPETVIYYSVTLINHIINYYINDDDDEDDSGFYDSIEDDEDD